MSDSISALDFQAKSLAAQAANTATASVITPTNTWEVDYIKYKNDEGKVQKLQIPTYTFNGMSGLSLTQVAIMVTLNRANEMEGKVIETMEVIAKNNVDLEVINLVTEQLAKLKKGESKDLNEIKITYQAGLDDKGNVVQKETNVKKALIDLGLTTSSHGNEYTYDECLGFYNELKTKLDELNSLNQEEMINLQSYVNKRDQAYELGSNINKLFFAGFMSIARNM